MSAAGAGADVVVGATSRDYDYPITFYKTNLQSFTSKEVMVFFPFLIVCFTVTDFPISLISNVSSTTFPDFLGVQVAVLFFLLNTCLAV